MGRKQQKYAIGLFSGGLDSAVSIALALRRGVRVKLLLFFDYGQKAGQAELKAVRSFARYWKIPYQVVRLEWLGKLSSDCALTNPGKKIPQLRPADLGNRRRLLKTAEAVWVPNRNGLFINIAAAFAEVMEANYIITGFNREEARTFPDNSSGFIKSINRTFRWGTRNRVRVVSYTSNLDKQGIMKAGKRLGLPLEKTWSCYAGGNKPCGKCESCLRRQNP